MCSNVYTNKMRLNQHTRWGSFTLVWTFVSSSEAPEEEYDPRSLFERLQEQKDKKQEEFEEQFKFSKLLYWLWQISGLKLWLKKEPVAV